jgi:hypothetical protein
VLKAPVTNAINSSGAAESTGETKLKAEIA